VRSYTPIAAAKVRDLPAREALVEVNRFLRHLSPAFARAQTTIAALAGGVAGGAPLAASYVTAIPEGLLTNARRLAATSPVTIADSGPGGAVTIGLAGGGWVRGPAVSVVGDVAIFSDIAGTLIGDAGFLASDCARKSVAFPAGAVPGNLAALDVTGKILSDSGVASATLTNVVTAAVVFATTDKIITADGTSRGVQARAKAPTIDANGRINFPATAANQNFSTSVANAAANAGFLFKDLVVRPGGDMIAYENSVGNRTFRVRVGASPDIIIGTTAASGNLKVNRTGFYFGVDATGGGTPVISFANPSGGEAELTGAGGVSIALYADAYGRGFSVLPFGGSPTVAAMVTVGLTPVVQFTAAGGVDSEGELFLGEATPAQITANQDDYDPGTVTVLRLSTDASWSITGFTGGASGRMLYIYNVGAHELTLAHLTGSSAGNQIKCAIGADLVLMPEAAALLYYDLTDTVWRANAI